MTLLTGPTLNLERREDTHNTTLTQLSIGLTARVRETRIKQRSSVVEGSRPGARPEEKRLNPRLDCLFFSPQLTFFLQSHYVNMVE